MVAVRPMIRASITSILAILLATLVAVPGRADSSMTTTPDFSLRVSPTSGTGTVGFQALLTDAITVTTAGPAQGITFSVHGLPAFATYEFSPPSVMSGGSSRLWVTTAPYTYSDVYRLTIVATGWYVTHTATFDFHLLCGPPWIC